MENTELSYLAGLIDGEGCISIVKTTVDKDLKSPRFRLRLTITNTNKALMDWLASLGWCILDKGNKNPRWKNCWQAVLNDRRAANLIRELKPLFRVKGDEADVALEFQEHKDQFNGGSHSLGHRGAIQLSPDIVEYRNKLKARLSELKHLNI